jgi:hypothetical protein
VEKEVSPLEAATKQRLMKTEKTFMCVIVTVIFGVCSSLILSLFVVTIISAQQILLLVVSHSRDNIIGRVT